MTQANVTNSERSTNSTSNLAIAVLISLIAGGIGGYFVGREMNRISSPRPSNPPSAPIEQVSSSSASETVPRASVPVSPAIMKPVLPIKVGVRKASMGEGFVLNFVNDGERHLKFTVTLRRTTLNQAKSFELRLDPGKSQEIGWAEGTVFYPGDTVVLEHPDFSRRVLNVNPGNSSSGVDILEGYLK